jgi:hypothetical protein
MKWRRSYLLTGSCRTIAESFVARQPDHTAMQQSPDNGGSGIPLVGQRNRNRRRTAADKSEYQDKNKRKAKAEGNRRRVSENRLQTALSDRQHRPQLVIVL